MSKSWHLQTPYLMSLSRIIARPHPVDRSGKPLFDSSTGTQIRDEDGRKIKAKPRLKARAAKAEVVADQVGDE